MLYNELKERGLVFQETSENLKNALEKPMSFYCGFDPTSDSLHIGSLLPLITMRRLQQYGHTPIVLLGGATGMIGDPSGKSKERVLLTKEIIAANMEGIRKNVERIISFIGTNAGLLVNNMDWMEEYSFIHFLRDIGKHFSVNAMLAKDSVKNRIENRDQGISYTEFSYMLLQSYDYYFLNQKQACQLQIGASDQWGNITAGVDLIRRMQGDDQNKEVCFGLTFPLVTKSDGSKFGKSESGNVWLDPNKTSPYQFYQFFLRLSDEEVLKLQKFFSLKSLDELKKIEEEFKAEPHKRVAQLSLAKELTILIHGEEEFRKAEAASLALFSGDFASLDKKTLIDVFSEVPSLELKKQNATTLIDLLVESKLCSSKGAARKDIKAGAIYINNNKFENEDLSSQDFPLLFDSLLILRRGKKNYCLVKFN
jgi:tyrosyl-tRNA synthetase